MTTAAEAELLTTPPNNRYGWLPDRPDANDYPVPEKYKAIRIPSSIDLRASGFTSRIKDQDGLGSCTGNGIARNFEFAMRRQGQVMSDRSRLFIYYLEREMEGTINSDSGAFIRDGLKVVEKFGAPSEELWPYNVPAFMQRPPQQAFDEALTHQALSYHSVKSNSMRAVKQVLAAGSPIVLGFSVYRFFEDTGPTGEVRIPSDPSQYGSLLGGHCVAIEGYDQLKINPKRTVYGIGANSWSETWGDKGYFYMPLKWLCDLRNADDFWTILIVE